MLSFLEQTRKTKKDKLKLHGISRRLNLLFSKELLEKLCFCKKILYIKFTQKNNHNNSRISKRSKPYL